MIPPTIPSGILYGIRSEITIGISAVIIVENPEEFLQRKLARIAFL